MKFIKSVGVVGAGTMGSALAQKFAQEGFHVVLADQNLGFVQRGLDGITTMLQQGVERNVFTPESRDRILSAIVGTDHLEDLKDCDLVVEAIYESFSAKAQLFVRLSSIVRVDCIVATNTSSFSITELAGSVTHPERFVGMHYFFHAAKNRLVEIIPGERTSIETIELMRMFSVQSGKDALICRDSHGFVVNRFFVPWLNESARLLEEHIANIPTIDDVCMKVFGIGMGPFALMNATGVPVAYHSQKTLEVFGPVYAASTRLGIQTELNRPWDLQGDVSNDSHVRTLIEERMLGIVFFVCTQLLDEHVCTATDINRGARIGLRWRFGPIELMKRLSRQGDETVRKLIQNVASCFDVPSPTSIGDFFWHLSSVELEKKGNCAVITMSRPEDMNALNVDEMEQLNDRFSEADGDPDIDTIYIVGRGKAFVAGADVKFFVKNISGHSIEAIEAFTRFGQSVYEKIDSSKKTVVAILNGLALGGGLELALCADIILALPNASMGFPETGIGIYPALGGTQRSARRVGKALSKFLILSGRMLKASEAMDIGLVDEVIPLEVMFRLLNAEQRIVTSSRPALSDKWKAIEEFFASNNIENIVKREYVDTHLPSEEAGKLSKTISFKAPLAVKIADRLIDEQRGCASELEQLSTIFSSSDAFLGLSSIGQKVTFTGN